MTISIATTHFDQSRIGSGRRRVVVLNEGRAWATLFYLPTLTRFRVPLKDLRAAEIAPREPITGAFKRRVRARIALARKCGERWSRRTTDAILSA